MTTITNHDVIVNLINALRANGNYCAAIHVQKAAYLLQELCGKPLGLTFIMHSDGPHSFDLSEQISMLIAYEVLEQESNPPYGPRLCIKNTNKVVSVNNKKIEKDILFVATQVGSKNIDVLEKLTSALFIVKREKNNIDLNYLAQELHECRPHISLADASLYLSAINSLKQSLNQKINKNLHKKIHKTAQHAAT
ncbi:MAG: hypothetical protein JW841_00615 [Deltaproteobacteria bacterium]|nr:hypothetical protein [Deltaproteobacteria bacterium]